MASSVTSNNNGEDKYRSYLHGEGENTTTWRYGAPPNYDVVNKLFEEGRTKVSLLTPFFPLFFFFFFNYFYFPKEKRITG